MNNTSLWNKNFMFLLTGHAFAQFGHYLLMFALPLYVLYATGSPAIFGSIVAVAYLPLLFISPIGGVFADRISKKRIIVAMQFSTSVLIFLFIWASGFMSAIPIIVILLVGLYSISGLGSSAIDAGVPQIVPESQIVRATGMVGFMGQVPEFVAPLVAGLLFVRVGLTPIIVISGICYMLAAVAAAFLKIPHVQQAVTESIPAMIKDDIKTIAKYLSKENPQMVKVVMPLALLMVVLLPMIPIGLPILVIEHLEMSSSMLGIASGIVMFGGVISSVIASVAGDKLKISDCPKLLMVATLAMIPIGIIFVLELSAIIMFIVIIVCATVIMITATLYLLRIWGYIQVETPEEILGKVLSAVGALVGCVTPLGFFLYGVVFERFENVPWVVIFFAAVVSFGITFYSAWQFRKVKR
ncbi:MAG: MFS transporter [Oscillospiraceae bacterium]|nr:MFS transporter [Oscillospiraceae bacterium]